MKQTSKGGSRSSFLNHMNSSWEEKTISDFQFRSDDYFQELADAYNRHLALLKDPPTQDPQQGAKPEPKEQKDQPNENQDPR